MNRFALNYRVRPRASRVRGWCRLRSRRDDGFVLMEAIVSIGIITVIMASLTMVFVTSIRTTDAQRARQAAIKLVTEQADIIQANKQDIDAMPAQITPTVNGIIYTIKRASDPAVTIGGSTYRRETLTAKWDSSHCPTGGCTYSDSVLINTDEDPSVGEPLAPPATPALDCGALSKLIKSGQTVDVQLLSTCSVTGGVAPFTWKATGISANLTALGHLNGAVGYTGCFGPSGTVAVTDAYLRTASYAFGSGADGDPLQFAPKPQWVWADKNGATGAAVNVDLNPFVRGGYGPYTFKIVSGALPTGLALDPNSGKVTGIPQRSDLGPGDPPADVVKNTTVEAKDSHGKTVQGVVEWNIHSRINTVPVKKGDVPGSSGDPSQFKILQPGEVLNFCMWDFAKGGQTAYHFTLDPYGMPKVTPSPDPRFEFYTYTADGKTAPSLSIRFDPVLGDVRITAGISAGCDGAQPRSVKLAYKVTDPDGVGGFNTEVRYAVADPSCHA